MYRVRFTHPVGFEVELSELSYADAERARAEYGGLPSFQCEDQTRTDTVEVTAEAHHVGLIRYARAVADKTETTVKIV